MRGDKPIPTSLSAEYLSRDISEVGMEDPVLTSEKMSTIGSVPLRERRGTDPGEMSIESKARSREISLSEIVEPQIRRAHDHPSPQREPEHQLQREDSDLGGDEDPVISIRPYYREISELSMEDPDLPFTQRKSSTRKQSSLRGIHPSYRVDDAIDEKSKDLESIPEATEASDHTATPENGLDMEKFHASLGDLASSSILQKAAFSLEMNNSTPTLSHRETIQNKVKNVLTKQKLNGTPTELSHVLVREVSRLGMEDPALGRQKNEKVKSSNKVENDDDSIGLDELGTEETMSKTRETSTDKQTIRKMGALHSSFNDITASNPNVQKGSTAKKLNSSMPVISLSFPPDYSMIKKKATLHLRSLRQKQGIIGTTPQEVTVYPNARQISQLTLEGTTTTAAVLSDHSKQNIDDDQSHDLESIFKREASSASGVHSREDTSSSNPTKASHHHSLGAFVDPQSPIDSVHKLNKSLPVLAFSSKNSPAKQQSTSKTVYVPPSSTNSLNNKRQGKRPPHKDFSNKVFHSSLDLSKVEIRNFPGPPQVVLSGRQSSLDTSIATGPRSPPRSVNSSPKKEPEGHHPVPVSFPSPYIPPRQTRSIQDFHQSAPLSLYYEDISNLEKSRVMPTLKNLFPATSK